MNFTGIFFCAASLALSLAASVLLFPLAAISESELRASRTATPAYEMGDLDLGDFGQVSVQELMDYYIENPPQTPAGDVVSRRVRFQGC